MCHEPIEALDEFPAGTEEPLAFGVAGLRIAVVPSSQVAGQMMPRTGVCLAIGNPGTGRRDRAACREVATLEFVVGWIVTGRLLDLHPIGGILRQAETEAIALNGVVALALATERSVLDAKDEPR